MGTFAVHAGQKGYSATVLLKRKDISGYEKETAFSTAAAVVSENCRDTLQKAEAVLAEWQRPQRYTREMTVAAHIAKAQADVAEAKAGLQAVEESFEGKVCFVHEVGPFPVFRHVITSCLFDVLLQVPDPVPVFRSSYFMKAMPKILMDSSGRFWTLGGEMIPLEASGGGRSYDLRLRANDAPVSLHFCRFCM